tara:strand:+ start:46135 stop:47040 length:906 start_codon:yes stop_codon:yes gene_type:complete
MFGIEALDVVIGMIFIYLLFSLFVSIVNEMINSALNIRGREQAIIIRELLDNDDKKTASFFNHEKMKALVEPAGWFLQSKNLLSPQYFAWDIDRLRLPDSITSEKFANVYSDMTNTKLNRTELIDLFDDAIYLSRTRFKRKLRRTLFGLGLLVSALFNINSIHIFSVLKDNPEIRNALVQQATEYAEKNSSLPKEMHLDPSDLKKLKDQLDTLRSSQIEMLDAGLGIGWDFKKIEKKKDAKTEDYVEVIFEHITITVFFGWIITALAISMGAPFWFDLLRKVVNIKNELKRKGQKGDGALG